MTMLLLGWGLLAFLCSFVITVFVKHFAIHHGVVDRPKKKRNVHKRATAQLGGIAIYLAFVIATATALFFSSTLIAGDISTGHYIGLMFGGLILMVGGYLDDQVELPPYMAIFSPILAALAVIVFGIEIEKLTNPFGGVIYLSSVQSDILVFVWLMVVMYTTKFLDGLDGLATSVTTIGAIMIMLLSLTAAYYQPDVALLSVISIGAFLGFLFWNFHPASIFLGEGGSTFVGFLLGSLAVISGGKLATALLVLGIPLLDVIWVIVRRLKKGGIANIFKGDRKHLHHRLLDLGWGQRAIVFVYVLIATTFGISTLFLQSRDKLVALIVLTLMMLLAAWVLVSREKHYEQ